MSDFRLALRELRAAPIVTAVAILSLALGIGANTAIFSVVNSLLLRPLPVVEPEQLAAVSDARSSARGNVASFTFAVWEELRQRAQGIDGACAWWTERLNLSPRGGETQVADGLWVSGGFFTTLGVPPLLGRAITLQDDVAGAPAVAVISYDMWQRRFGGADNAVGTTLVVERVPFTIVGVAPPGFFGGEVGRTFDVALPMNAEPLIRGERSHISRRSGFFALTILLRRERDQSLDATEIMLRGIQPQVREAAMPPALPAPLRKEFLSEPLTAMPAATGTSRLRTRYERPLAVILVVVALVLLIACANIANLQLARAIARRHELSVKVALGASRWRLARQWLVESLLLSTAGALLGLVFAAWSSRLLVSQLSSQLNRIHLDLSFDWRLLLFTGTIAVGTAVLFGTLPAWRGSTAAPIDALNEKGRGSAGGAPARLSDGMVVAQVALAVVIVVGAGLFVRTFAELATMPLGFETNRVLLVNMSMARSERGANRIELVQRVVRDVRAVPGVATAAASLNTPVSGFGMIDLVHAPGGLATFGPMIDGKLGPHSTYANYITPGWFTAYGTPLRAGRDFNDGDVKGGLPVVIVNEAFVRKFMAGKDPVGATVAFERGLAAPVVKTVVGVVGDAVHDSLRNDDAPTEYAPLTQLDFPGPGPVDVAVTVRAASGDPMLLARGVGAAITRTDGDITFAYRAMTEQVSSSLTQERLVAMLSGFFAALALLLAGLGLYGMISYSVVRRRGEIGVRIALGSTGARIVKLVVARAAWIVAAGILIGAVASAWAAKFVSTLVFRVDPQDPVTLVAAAATLAVVGTAAAWLPAYRASRLDPASVLRQN